jgi:predicted membrane-bound spermidine synthase
LNVKGLLVLISDVVAVRRSAFALMGALFFASGFAALLYQIAWQRMLFSWYGVDLDSVSVIVSIFMLGLGLGAIIGGWLADLFQHHRILAFSIIELTVAVFGFFSFGVIDGIGALFVANSIPRLIALTFIVFVVPTCAMGATLPLLVTEMVARTQNVGLSTGSLYFINTLGAAAGAFAAGFVLLSINGLDGLIVVAVTLNLLVSTIAYVAFRRGP